MPLTNGTRLGPYLIEAPLESEASGTTLVVVPNWVTELRRLTAGG